MIRRDEDGTCVLISQHDHAALSGTLAGHVGNRNFDVPARRESWLLGVALHDAGWPTHDDRPTLNPSATPRDVFESSPTIALTSWQRSADVASARDPYAGLLVSLHGLSLSILACSRNTGEGLEHFDLQNPHVRFAVNKFQHREIERQEQLRGTLGLRTDLPLLHGLAEPGADGREDLLTYHFRWLQALDLMSLGLCCTDPPSDSTQDVFVKPNGRTVRFRLKRRAGTTLLVSPWPFDVPKIALSTPARRLSAQTYASDEAFRSAYQSASTFTLELSVEPF